MKLKMDQPRLSPGVVRRRGRATHLEDVVGGGGAVPVEQRPLLPVQGVPHLQVLAARVVVLQLLYHVVLGREESVTTVMAEEEEREE